jgi:hypothetical protein
MQSYLDFFKVEAMKELFISEKVVLMRYSDLSLLVIIETYAI